MEKALRIPELVRLICEYSTPADNVHLALTCRDLFRQAIPNAWAYVPSVAQLLMLIEGATCEKSSQNHKFGGIILQLPGSLEGIYQSRFNFYAPFVTTLDIYNNEHQLLWVVQLKSFARFASTRVLLPNLRRLTIASIHSSSKSYALWVDIFSCPSLLEIRIPGTNPLPLITHVASSHITGTLLRNCPNIRKLELFWDVTSSDAYIQDDDDMPPTYGDYTPRTETFVHRLLPHFTFLTSIIGSVSLLEASTLLALGSLPELRHLEIHYPTDEWDIFSPIQLLFPPESFPKLDRLVLSNLIQSDAAFIWNIPVLVARLRSATLRFIDLLDDNDQGGTTFQPFVHLLCARSPHINDLVLVFNCQGAGDVEPYTCDFTQDAFSALTKLKLAQLQVLGARLVGDAPVKSLATAWPNIQVLRWPDQHIKPSDLSLFAANLSELKHLALEIDFDLPLDESLIKPPTTISQRQLRTLESRFHLLGNLDGDQGSKFYWFLRQLVPNAKLVTRSDPFLDSLENRGLDLACVEAINEMERALRAFEEPSCSNEDEVIRKRVSFAWGLVLVYGAPTDEFGHELTQRIISSFLPLTGS